MPCEQIHTQLHGYLDGELDATGAATFEKHLETCPDCQKVLAAEESVRSSLQQADLYERAPLGLKNKLTAQLGPKPSLAPRRNPAWQWLAVAAGLLLVAGLGWWQFAGGPRAEKQMIASAFVDAHLRSLQAGHLVDVQSTDQHTVKPWFDGKLDFAPPVRDFASDGFPLVGGRLDVVQGRTVAALVYGRRKHFVNVFVEKKQPKEYWDGAGEFQGYHWLAWRSGDFAFCAIADTAPADLEELKRLIVQPN